MVIGDVGLLAGVGVNTGRPLVLTLHLCQLSILVCDVDHHLLALGGNLLCTLPVIHLPFLHALSLVLISTLLLLKFS